MLFSVEVEARTGPAGLEQAAAAAVLGHVAGEESAVLAPEVYQDPARGAIGLRCTVEADDADLALRAGVRALARGMVAAGLSATRGYTRLVAR
jgi:hypothetical protein